jgi:hypothetical protein
MNGTLPVCKCIMGYSGVNCEILSTFLVIRKSIINTATIIAIIVITCYIFTIIGFDFTKYFLLKEKKQPIKNQKQLQTLIYHP